MDLVISVAETVPLGLLGLSAPGKVCSPGTQTGQPRPFDTCQELPPLPAMPLPLADQAGTLPCSTANAHIDAIDRRGS